MQITVDTFKSGLRRLTIGTKTMITTIVTGTSLVQVQEIRDFVIKHTVAHPRLSSIGLGVIGVLVVLHNPKVQKFLHIEVDQPIG